MAKTTEKLSWRRRRRRLRAGQALMVLGGLILASHLAWHVGGTPPGLEDVFAGYPAGAALFFVGAVAAGV